MSQAGQLASALLEGAEDESAFDMVKRLSAQRSPPGIIVDLAEGAFHDRLNWINRVKDKHAKAKEAKKMIKDVENVDKPDKPGKRKRRMNLH